MTGQSRYRNRDVKPQKQSGFTLLEVLIAMAIMIVGISSALVLFSTAASLQGETTLLHRMSDLADTLFSETAAQLKSGVDLKAIAVKDATHPDFPRFKYSVTIIPLDDFEDELFVCADIYYLWRGEKRTYRFSTILLRYLGTDSIRPTSTPSK
jgi:prepilin-type N-terminal cleavage/methylation domain-containing protein